MKLPLELDEEEFKRANELWTEFNKQSKSPLELIDELKKFKNELFAKRNIKDVLTKVPKQWIMLVDKASSKAFDGKGTLCDEKGVEVSIGGRKSKKEIVSLLCLGYKLTPYDREVHDALVTLYVDGGNEYITPQMIYKAMTGNRKAKLTPKQLKAISNSLNKLMYSKLVIRASDEECEAYNFEKWTYESTVIQGEKTTARMNGEVIETYHLLREPALYTYAGLKNQISRLDIKLLNSPVNKNEENITLQSYLLRRMGAIKKSTELYPTILYNTIYEQLDIQASSDGALRKKKLKVRNTVKKILDYLKAQNFIKNYTENIHGQEVISITISY